MRRVQNDHGQSPWRSRWGRRRRRTGLGDGLRRRLRGLWRRRLSGRLRWLLRCLRGRCALRNGLPARWRSPRANYDQCRKEKEISAAHDLQDTRIDRAKEDELRISRPHGRAQYCLAWRVAEIARVCLPSFTCIASNVCLTSWRLFETGDGIVAPPATLPRKVSAWKFIQQ